MSRWPYTPLGMQELNQFYVLNTSKKCISIRCSIKELTLFLNNVTQCLHLPIEAFVAVLLDLLKPHTKGAVVLASAPVPWRQALGRDVPVQRLEVTAVEEDAVPEPLGDEPLEDVEERVEDPGVVDDVARPHFCWYRSLEIKISI